MGLTCWLSCEGLEIGLFKKLATYVLPRTGVRGVLFVPLPPGLEPLMTQNGFCLAGPHMWTGVRRAGGRLVWARQGHTSKQPSLPSSSVSGLWKGATSSACLPALPLPGKGVAGRQCHLVGAQKAVGQQCAQDQVWCERAERVHPMSSGWMLSPFVPSQSRPCWAGLRLLGRPRAQSHPATKIALA